MTDIYKKSHTPRRHDLVPSAATPHRSCSGPTCLVCFLPLFSVQHQVVKTRYEAPHPMVYHYFPHLINGHGAVVHHGPSFSNQVWYADRYAYVPLALLLPPLVAWPLACLRGGKQRLVAAAMVPMLLVLGQQSTRSCDTWPTWPK